MHEGVLQKWTNYWNGWQSRYFQIDRNGIISYFLSKDTTVSSSRGSIKIDACNIVVNPKDSLRFDLCTPTGTRLCLRCLSKSDRHEWLQVLGQFKAGMVPPVDCSSDIVQPLEFNPAHAIRLKRAELQVYCDGLTEQIRELRLALDQRPLPTNENFDEALHKIQSLCDEFSSLANECCMLMESPYPD
ncbi:hypothetical protein GJ496_008210 [Pomphorhynchus laevis]|nr:hypothetical protein GJ496_008210 [Pomphorhynchus laevis]